MFPVLRQRVGIFVVCLLGSLLLAQAAGGPGAADAELGWRLWGGAAHGGASEGISGGVSIVGWMLPVVVMGGVLGAMGNVLTGWFVVSFVLMTLAWRGGSIDGWMRRASLPGEYWSLAKEAVVWMVLLLAAMGAVQWVSLVVRKKLPAQWRGIRGGATGQSSLGAAVIKTIAGGAVTALVAGLLGHVLIRSSQPGQVMIGLIIAFMVGGLAGTMVQTVVWSKSGEKDQSDESCSHKESHWINLLGILVSPGVVAVVMYGWIAMGKQGHDEILSAWYRLKLSGLVQVMPVQYVAAGCVGVMLGIGWAQGLLQPGEVTENTNSQVGDGGLAVGQGNVSMGANMGGTVNGGTGEDGKIVEGESRQNN